MAAKLDGKRVAILATDGVEEMEYTKTRAAVEAAGGTVELISLGAEPIQSVDHLDKSATYEVDRVVTDADPAGYDALVLPGGVANPDFLRADPNAVRFVRTFVESGKPVAAICHGLWPLVEANVVQGRTLTSWPSLRTDLANAGATWVDEEVYVDNGLITSRRPGDLPAFCATLVAEIADGGYAGSAS
ncbi:type 1 glutamine amidotransferase domain-containing protein [Salinispora cortesiana]|uniref:type 1 glutamine amidotransferase domain-containing protein n=1 Tax=Salinispora cortesiana TaxID=1305843 RepID=UPI0004217304|nr:type 1 glutamine amidotransferase domain-containing protein [Salinispora cortesiana]